MIGRSLLMASCLSTCISVHEALHAPFGTAAATPPAPSHGRGKRRRQHSLPPSFSPLEKERHLQQTRFPMDTLRFTFGRSTNNPSYMDYKTMMCQVDYFYTDFLQEGRPEASFTDVILQVIDWSFDGKDEYPISISYLANATDESGNNFSAEDMNAKLASRNFFLKRMVKASWPEGENVFHATTDIQQETDTWTKDQVDQAEVKFSTLHCPERGTFTAKISYGFFDGEEANPSRQEVFDLQEQTNQFMANVVEEALQMDDLDIEFKTSNIEYEEGGPFPLNITYEVKGFFADETQIPYDTLKYHLASKTSNSAELMEQYIRESVWEVPPKKEGTFYSVNKARMETKVHRLTKEELQESDIFTQALDDSDEPDEEDLPLDKTDMTDDPTVSPTISPSPTASPTSNPTDAADEETSDAGTDRGQNIADGDNPAVEDDGDSGEEASAGGGGPVFGGGGPSFGFGGGTGGIPQAGSIPSSGNGGGPSRPGSVSGGSMGLTNPFARPGSSGTLIPGGVLRPDRKNETECEDAIDQADKNHDKLLSQAEYIVAINLLTDNNYPEYVFTALPAALKDDYTSLATHRLMGEGMLIPTSKEAENSEDQIVEDAIRKNIICRSMKRAINKIVDEDPIRNPARISPAQIGFMASCDGEECADTGNATLTRALRIFLNSDIKPIFEAIHDEHDAFLAAETTNITALDEIDCPRHDEDPGDDNVHCFLVTAEFVVRREGDEPEHTKELVEEAQNTTMDAINVGLMSESLKLINLENPSTWTVYKSVDEVLSLSPSAAPTELPSLSPTMEPTQQLRAANTKETNAPTKAPTTRAPSRTPTPAPSATYSEPPSMSPTAGPTEDLGEDAWIAQAFGIEGAGVGWLAAAGIAAMIVLQFFREFLVDIAVKVLSSILNFTKWLFGYETDDYEDDSDDDDENEDNEEESKQEEGTQ